MTTNSLHQKVYLRNVISLLECLWYPSQSCLDRGASWVKFSFKGSDKGTFLIDVHRHTPPGGVGGGMYTVHFLVPPKMTFFLNASYGLDIFSQRYLEVCELIFNIFFDFLTSLWPSQITQIAFHSGFTVRQLQHMLMLQFLKPLVVSKNDQEIKKILKMSSQTSKYLWEKISRP